MQSVIFDIHVHVQGYHLRELETAVLGLVNPILLCHQGVRWLRWEECLTRYQKVLGSIPSWIHEFFQSSYLLNLIIVIYLYINKRLKLLVMDYVDDPLQSH